MWINTTVEDFPKEAERHHLSPETPITVIIKKNQQEEAQWLQEGDKSVSWEFDAVEPEPGSRLASDIVIEQRRQ